MALSIETTRMILYVEHHRVNDAYHKYVEAQQKNSSVDVHSAKIEWVEAKDVWYELLFTLTDLMDISERNQIQSEFIGNPSLS
jgi:hypothetical protein